LNAVLEIGKQGDADNFLRDLLEIEKKLGRERKIRYAARTCDLDLLLWGAEIIQRDNLMVPHPRLAKRKFVLIPLCDLISDALHPELKKPFRDLLAECPDTLNVWPFSSEP
jgi:2-amino-4-hydroxy-6-hydroxymethyldihydropteridine diphosphokinase